MQYRLQDIEGKSGKIVCFESFGVRVGIQSEYAQFLERIADQLPATFPVGTKQIENSQISQLFVVKRRVDGAVEFFRNGERGTEGGEEDNVLKFMLSRIRLTVAEYAPSRVFIHAGVVIWKEKAIVLPGNSYSGKTTLVSELIKRGALYFSDEYAIIDEQGLVHPFPKTLSIRGIIDEYQQVEHSPEELGGKIGRRPRPVGMILFTEYEEGAVLNPKPLSKGEAVLKIVSFTLPIRVAPAFTLKVLQNAASSAVTCESKRGDAEKSAPDLLEFFDRSVEKN